jgi:hypothetical protein
LNAKKNVNLNFIFASTVNVKPLTVNRGLRSGVNKINVNLKVSIVFPKTYRVSLVGKNTTRITKILAEEGINISRTSVSKFLERYRKSGSLFDAPRSGRKSN